MKFKPTNVSDVENMFQQIDELLAKSKRHLTIKVLGGMSILLMGVRERSTMDIDVAATSDAEEFQSVCKSLGIPVDVVTIATTVDLLHCPTLSVFQGRHLHVESVTLQDLLKLKLERFYKQDPEDIYAIISHESMSYDEFKAIVSDMLPDFIGNIRSLIISSQIVVEQLWPDKSDEFKKSIKGS